MFCCCLGVGDFFDLNICGFVLLVGFGNCAVTIRTCDTLPQGISAFCSYWIAYLSIIFFYFKELRSWEAGLVSEMEFWLNGHLTLLKTMIWNSQRWFEQEAEVPHLRFPRIWVWALGDFSHCCLVSECSGSVECGDMFKKKNQFGLKLKMRRVSSLSLRCVWNIWSLCSWFVHSQCTELYLW